MDISTSAQLKTLFWRQLLTMDFTHPTQREIRSDALRPIRVFTTYLRNDLPSIRTFFTQTKGYMLTIGQSVMQAKGSTE
jgi:hypothetical protein